MGGNEGGGRGGERWSLFGVRPIVQKSPTDPGSETNTPGGFTLQSYFGIQKSNTMDAIKTKINLTVEDPANFNSPKMEMSGEEGKKTSCHRLRHRDMNILTPSGFWTPQVLNSLKLPRLLYTHYSTNWHLTFYGLLWVTTHKLILFSYITLIEFPFKLDKRLRISYISAKHQV